MQKNSLTCVYKKLPFLVACIFVAIAGQVNASVDVSGASDSSVINRYPLSYIEEYSQVLAPEYRLALGSMQKVNGVVSPEKSDFIDGQLTRITYRIPHGHSSKAAFDYVFEQIKSTSHEVLYTCQARGCGSSSDWANSQFGIAKLYGIDREQYYLAARLSQPAESIVVIYAVQRGNKRVYLHLDVIRPKSKTGLVTANTLLRRLQRGERVFFADQGWNKSEIKALADAIDALLVERPRSDIWLIGHQGKSGPFERLLNDGAVAAGKLKTRLVETGVQGMRLKTFGIGALAPAHSSEVPENRIEVMVE